MKNSLLFGISLFFGSFLIAQNTSVSSASAKPTAAVNLPYSYGFETPDLDQ